MRRGDLVDILTIVLCLAFVALNLWLWFAAPCALYSFTPAGDVPARCLMP